MMSAANTIQNQRDDQIEMSMLNPAMVESAGATEQRKLNEETKAMMKERLKLVALDSKKQAASAAKKPKKTGRGRGAKMNSKKKEFGGNVTEVNLTEEDLSALVAVPFSDNMFSAKEEQIKSKKGMQNKKLSFARHKSDKGVDYYSNVETNETTWALPEGAIVEGEETETPVRRTSGKRSSKSDAAQLVQTKNAYLGPKKRQSKRQSKTPLPGLGKKKQSFRKLTTDKGLEYFQNVDQPEETLWTVPGDAEIIL